MMVKTNSPSYSEEMKPALGSGFPKELELSKPTNMIVDYEKNKLLGERLTKHTIYVTPSDTFSIEFRHISMDTEITHYSGKESHTWLYGPNMKYWPQQLNFALWCLTTECGVSSDLLFEKRVPKQVISYGFMSTLHIEESYLKWYAVYKAL